MPTAQANVHQGPLPGRGSILERTALLPSSKVAADAFCLQSAVCAGRAAEVPMLHRSLFAFSMPRRKPGKKAAGANASDVVEDEFERAAGRFTDGPASGLSIVGGEHLQRAARAMQRHPEGWAPWSARQSARSSLPL